MTRAGNEGPRSCHSARGEGQKAPTTTMVFFLLKVFSARRKRALNSRGTGKLRGPSFPGLG